MEFDNSCKNPNPDCRLLVNLLTKIWTILLPYHGMWMDSKNSKTKNEVEKRFASFRYVGDHFNISKTNEDFIKLCKYYVQNPEYKCLFDTDFSWFKKKKDYKTNLQDDIQNLTTCIEAVAELMLQVAKQNN